MVDNFSVNLSNGLRYPYKVIQSKRAKYLRIKLSAKGELSVTLPSFTRVESAHEFIRSKQEWIENNVNQISKVKTETIPNTLNLRLLDEIWKVTYKENNAPNLKLIESDHENIEILGNRNLITDPLKVAKILNNWCKKKAKVTFNQMLQELAELHGFHYQRLSIRAQKTRWGSCSQNRNINLNCKLLFMPKEIVSYVMIHELCHTLEMNHSTRFWNLVADCDPNFKNHRKELNLIGKTLY